MGINAGGYSRHVIALEGEILPSAVTGTVD